MKKMLISIMILVLMAFSAFAQEGTTTTITEPTQESTTTTTDSDSEESAEQESSEQESVSSDPISRLDIILPKFPAISSINDTIIQADLNALTNYVAVLRDDYLNRLITKIDLIVSDYTNDNFISPDDIDYVTLNLYDIVDDVMASDNNVALGVMTAEKALVLFNKTKPSLLAIGNTNDVNQIEYHLNLYSGILNMYAGSRVSMKKGLQNFYYILDNPINDEDPQMYRRLNSYIASLSYELLASELNNDIARRLYYNAIFDALWNIVENSSDSEQVKEGKYFVLLNQFASVLNTRSKKFTDVYSEYIKKMITLENADNQQTSGSSDVASQPSDATSSDTTASDTTEETSTTTNEQNTTETAQ